MAESSKRGAGRSATARDDETTIRDGEHTAPQQPREIPPPAGALDEGPGTGRDASEDVQPRSQARQHVAHAAAPSSSPIEAPDAHLQTTPAEGKAGSSTNAVNDAVGLSSYAGQDHVRLVDEDGNDVDLDSLFDDPGPGTTYVTVKRRVSEEFWANGQHRGDYGSGPSRKLLFPAGARLNKATVMRLKASYDKAQAQTAQSEN